MLSVSLSEHITLSQSLPSSHLTYMIEISADTIGVDTNLIKRGAVVFHLLEDAALISDTGSL